eukprot:6196242-Pleurochrysis_carterae.AAC.2
MPSRASSGTSTPTHPIHVISNVFTPAKAERVPQNHSLPPAFPTSASRQQICQGSSQGTAAFALSKVLTSSPETRQAYAVAPDQRLETAIEQATP